MWEVILVVIVAEIVAQSLKLYTHKKSVGELNFHILLSDGGMPSGHSTTVSALTTMVFFNEGFSMLFVVTLFFTLIVLRDATGVRRSAGRQAEVLNQLIAKHELKVKKLKELLGHTPLQMLAGVALGITIASIFHFWIL